MYEQQDSNLGNRSFHDGKISATKWMTGDGAGTNTNERAFKYTYDAVNRYTSEDYSERAGGTGSFNLNPDGFDESTISYDLNGNLLTLKRNSSSPGATSGTQIDNLHYYYNAQNPNQLQSVSDGATSQYTNAGFRNIMGVDTSHHYIYDGNGNLTVDPFKGITKITYDFLNRTDTVQTSSTQYLTYTYDGSGILLRKKQYSSGTLTTTTDYVDGFLYIKSGTGTETLSYFPMPEGRVVNVSGTLTQEFIITDQQGNARVSFWNNGSGVVAVKQENSYYGTGLILPNSPVGAPATPNKKLYNGGSEWQNDNTSGTYNLPDYYETFNRNYDAAIGRFVGVDPMAESAESMSGYQYAGDNPLMNNDPDGGRFGPPQYGTSGAAALMNEVAEFDASVAFADDPSTFSTWNGYDFGGAGAASNGQSIYHAGDGTDADPMTGSFENARQLWNETVNQEKIDAGETPDPGVNGGGTESPGGSSEGSPTTSPVAYPMESFLASTTTDVGTLVNNANQGGTGPWERLLLPTSAWNTQLPDMTGCFRGCEVMTGTQPPLNHAVLINRHNPQSAIAGLTALGNMLESGHPVIVGVDYKPGGPNADGITDHFVVIAGYGEDSNGDTYLRFYDPGTAHFSNGTSPTNRFYIDSGGFLVGHTAYAPSKTYTISQVRLP